MTDFSSPDFNAPPADTAVHDPLGLETVQIPVEQIRFRADNPNSMDDTRYAALVALIRRFGFLEPCLVRPIGREDPEYGAPYLYEMVQGHHRLKAMVEIGYTEIPCIVRELGDDAARALQLGMNRVRGELDLGAVARDLELLTQDSWGPDELGMLGFDASELDTLLAFARGVDSDLGAQIDGAVALPEGGPPKQKTRWVLELEFRTKDELVAVRRGLNALNRDHGLAVHALLGLADSAS